VYKLVFVLQAVGSVFHRDVEGGDIVVEAARAGDMVE